MNYKLNKELFFFEFDYTIIYDEIYRQYHRIKLRTVLFDDNGQINIMISRRYKHIELYIYYDNGLYIKLPEKIKNHKRLNRIVNKIILSFGDHFKPHSEEKIPVNVFLLLIDKMAVECGLNRKKQKIMMKYVVDKTLFTEMDIFNILGIFLKDAYHITKELEPILRVMINYQEELPATLTYKPQLNLEQFKFTNSTEARIPLISYEEFLETIEDFTDAEVLEMLGNYRTLEPYEYTRNIRRMLYRATQRFK